jgi:hypothetical protein
MSENIFNYIDDKNSKDMLENAYTAITLTEMWNYMKKDVESYCFNDDNEIQIISKKMSELGYNDHSGASFGITMRNMQFIAKYGLKEHEKKWKKG